jgi:low affinity Fe/Cu permease
MPNRTHKNGSAKAARAKAPAKVQAKATKAASRTDHSPHPEQGWFTWFAHEVARLAGKPATFLAALALIVIWAISGPLFGYSDTWQLVINTSTTIVTFLMVFLIQSTQNRDTLALQIKLADLIIAVRGTHNDMAAAEEMSDAELEALHAEYRRRAEHAEVSLAKRRRNRAH